MSSTKGRNNFTTEQGRSQSHYKLWVVYNDAGARKYRRQKAFWFSFNRKKDKDNGLLRLKLLAAKLIPFCNLVWLYDNLTGQRMDVMHQNKPRRGEKPAQAVVTHSKPKKPANPDKPKRKRIIRTTNRYLYE